MRIAAAVISTALTLIAVALVARGAATIVRVVRQGQPAVGRADHPAERWRTLVRETLGHTRMLQWRLVGAAHWFVFVGFGALFFTLVTAYGQLYTGATWSLPLVGHFWPYELLVELIALLTGVGILTLMVIRQLDHPRRKGRLSRFSGSRMWMAYYVELTVLAIAVCILILRGLEGAFAGSDGWSLHHPISAPLASAFAGASPTALEYGIYLVATVKIVVSLAWLVVIANFLTMGVAWHRFTAFFNIWFKRNADGGTALGPLQPMYSGGKPVDFEDPADDDIFGVGKVEEFTWKGILDFTTCTECGRCQSVCPAWDTGKPLSPKQFVMDLREHAYAKAADPDGPESERPLVGLLDAGGVIEPDVLWSCTTCGACVQECPVDIEHVDHVVDIRRNQVLVESEFPTELNQLYRGLESKGNPWNMPPSGRIEWAKDLPFEVKVLGVDVENLSEVDYLFWVGCAGAYDDRAKKTTRAVAELLHTAGVSFAVLGDAETCTGDPARRSGNEFVYQMLAQQNAETFREAQAAKVVVTCAHCFNTIKNEYRQLGVELEVVHHAQLLNRLVREGRLKPVAPDTSQGSETGSGSRSGSGSEPRELPVTYHDPCYLGRHNGVYSPPRELLAALPEVELREMPRNSEKSFCCGAGGARMWMEETIGTRVNLARTTEAVETGAERIATACPFCRVMLSDGVTEQQADGKAAESVEVVDVSQLLLEAVRRGQNGTTSNDA